MKDFPDGPMSVEDVVDALARPHEPKKIIDGIYVGDSQAYSSVMGRPDWSYCLASQTYHRALLGYLGRGAPKDSPSYLWHDVDRTLYLNLVDADSVKYIDDRVIEKALVWCLGEYGQHRTVLLACDKGQSRSPTLALMLLKRLGVFEKQSFQAAMAEMNDRLGGTYRPHKGMRDYLERWWQREYLDKLIEDN